MLTHACVLCPSVPPRSVCLRGVSAVSLCCAQNLVRDATSNTSEVPSPTQLRRIADACGYAGSYVLIFAQLHKRLTHLEYKRHVVKSLLVLDYLIRLKPPSVSVQLKLMVDVREHWNDLYRLARLRVQSSSATIQQIQRVAERLCEFIWRFEQGEVEAGRNAEDASPQTKTKTIIHPSQKRRRKKRREGDSSSSSSSSDSDSDEGELPGSPAGEGMPKDLLSPSRIPNFSARPQAAPVSNVPAVSPFGFDFGFWSDQSTDITAPHPSHHHHPHAHHHHVLPASAPNASSASAVPQLPIDPFAGLGEKQHSWSPDWNDAPKPPVESHDWVCSRCTFQNPSDQTQCVMCQSPRRAPAHGADDATATRISVHPPAPLVITSPTSVGSGGGGGSGGWSCRFCSFNNIDSARVCHVCDHARTTSGELNDPEFQRLEAAKQRGLNTDGSFTTTGEEEEKATPRSSAVSSQLTSPPRTLGRAAGGISCSWCQYLNPPTAEKCEICERDLGASAHAQRMKLQMAHQMQVRQAAAKQQANLSWQCVSCTHVNAAGAPRCARCRFNPSEAAAQAAAQRPASEGAAATSSHTAPASAVSSPAPFTSGTTTGTGIGMAGKSQTLPPGGLAPHLLDRGRSASVAVPTLLPVPQPTHGSARSGSVSLPASTSVSAGSSTTNSPSLRSHSRVGSVSTGGADLPEHDLLELLMEQAEGEWGTPATGVIDAPASRTHKRDQSVVEQVAAMNVYHEVAEKLRAGQWQCTHCSFINLPQHRNCEMCQKVRPSPNNPFDSVTVTSAAAASSSSSSASHSQSSRSSSDLMGAKSRTLPSQPTHERATTPTPSIAPTHSRPSSAQTMRPSSANALSQSHSHSVVSNPLNPFDMLQPLSPKPVAAAVARPVLAPPVAMPLRKETRSAEPQQKSQQQQIRATKPPQHAGAASTLPTPSLGVATPVAAAEWNCARCTFANPHSDVTCGMCDLPRASPSSAAAASSSSSSHRPLTRSRDSSPSGGRRTPVASGADPYSSLLAAGLKHSTSPLPIPSMPMSGARQGPYAMGPPMHVYSPSATVMALAPPTQPTRHRATSASVPSSRQNSADMSPYFSPPAAASATATIPSAVPSPSSSRRTGRGSLPMNFKIDFTPDSHAATGRESSFNSFDPAFPAADAFSHLHAGTGPKSPPNLSHFPAEDVSASGHSRHLSFTSMFNSNADLLARKAVGHIPAPGSQRPIDVSADVKPAVVPSAGLEMVGEGEPAAEEEDPEVAIKRAKEEKEARRRERAAKRERKAAKRAARAQAQVEEERQRLENLALQAATAASMAAAAQAQTQQKPLPATESAAVQPESKPHAPQPPPTLSQITVVPPQGPVAVVVQPSVQPIALPVASTYHIQPPLPTTPRPTLVGGIAPSHTPSPPPVPPMPVLSPQTLAALIGSSHSPASGSSASKSPSPDGHLDQVAMRQKVIDEIKSTEKSYVDSLFDLLTHFMEPMKKSMGKLGITPKQIALIFSNLTVLAQFHALFLADLIKSGDMVVEVFVQLSPFLKMYSDYVQRYEKSIATINSLRANSKFQKFLEDKRDLLKGRGIMTFLIMPVQR